MKGSLHFCVFTGIFLSGCIHLPAGICGSLQSQKFCGLIAKQLAAVDTDQCSWQVERYRETTARIFAWRNLNIRHSFTVESSLAGGKAFHKTDCQYNTQDFRQVGSGIYQALLDFWSEED